jgi:hypothetical protein
MSHRNSPPRQSAVQRARKPVTIHQEESVGHNRGVPPRKPVILDPANGSTYGGRGGAGGAPGACGEPTTGPQGEDDTSSW